MDLNLQALQSKGLSPADVVNAISVQNLILPSGTAKVGRFEYTLETNSAPTTIQGLNDLPIRSVNGATVYIHDVAHVRDGFPPQTNIVRVDGQRASLLTIQKTGNSSTLDIIKSIREKLPVISSQLPPQLKITPLSDQSLFVRSAISGVVREGIIAACLTGVMILDLSGKLAQHAHHRGFDSALDLVLDHPAERARRDDQHHDARRSGPGGRHPG